MVGRRAKGGTVAGAALNDLMMIRSTFAPIVHAAIRDVADAVPVGHDANRAVLAMMAVIVGMILRIPGTHIDGDLVDAYVLTRRKQSGGTFGG